MRDLLLDFVRREGAATDFLCLQEVDHEGTGKFPFVDEDPELFGKFADILPDHTGYFHPHFRDFFGLGAFVRTSVPVMKAEERFVHLHKGFEPEGDIGHRARHLQVITCEMGGKTFSVINFHGLWNGQGKGDSSDRLEQSRKIVEALKFLKGEIVLCGDFNLEPDTESMAIIEAAGLRNLVKEYGVTSTRTSLYTKPGKFADYILVSKGIKVKNFRVLPDEVSDHAPLMLEFEV